MFHWLVVTSPSKHSLLMWDLLAVVPLLRTVCQFPFTLQFKGRRVGYTGQYSVSSWFLLFHTLEKPGVIGQELSKMTPASTQTSNLRDILINYLPPACMIKLTTTFDISIHHLWTDSKRCTFTWSMPSKIVLQRKKSKFVREFSLLYWQHRKIVFMGFKNYKLWKSLLYIVAIILIPVYFCLHLCLILLLQE